MIQCGPASPCRCTVVLYVLLMGADLPAHFNALWLWEVNANERHGTGELFLSEKKQWCDVFCQRMEFFCLTDRCLFPSHIFFPLSSCLLFSLLPLPLSFICVCVHPLLMMFISYQVKFIHISCFITGPADNSFENINTRECENARYGRGREYGLSATGRCWIPLVAALRQN